MQQVSVPAKGRRQSGFTLFEMVVVICSIAILYLIAEQRLNDLPAAAERASFVGVLEQIKTGVKFAMYNKLAEGGNAELKRLAGTNPMALLLEQPSNYLGEMDQVTDMVRRRNAWYFETSTGELVYVVGSRSIEAVEVDIASVAVHPGQVRFRIDNIYLDEDGIARNPDEVGEAERQDLKWNGVLLVPVNEYQWGDRLDDPSELNLGSS